MTGENKIGTRGEGRGRGEQKNGKVNNLNELKHRALGRGGEAFYPAA